MLTLDRQNQVLNYLKTNKAATVVELASMFFIGQASIRRDLEKLEKMKLIKRTYGGAVLLQGLNDEIPISIREKEQSPAKEVIANLASQFIQDNDIIIIDSSTTSSNIINHIRNKQNLTVITNGTKTASQLSVLPQIVVYCCVGKQRANSLSLVGDQAKRFISNYSVQKLFFSCRALSTSNGAIGSIG